MSFEIHIWVASHALHQDFRFVWYVSRHGANFSHIESGYVLTFHVFEIVKRNAKRGIIPIQSYTRRAEYIFCWFDELLLRVACFQLEQNK